jgi:L-asparagine transporter-like permease
MSDIWQIILCALACVPLVWITLFISSWREARDGAPGTEAHEPLRMPRPPLIAYFTILPLYWLIFFLFWPAFVGHWLGRRRGGK